MENQGQIIPSYSKRPLWQWLALYTVIGAIAYGAVYYFFLAKKAENSYSPAPALNVTPTKPSGKVDKTETTPNPTVVEAQKKGEEVSVFLTPTGFIPPELTIKVGANVTWLNQTGITGNVSSAPHPVHTGFPPLNLGDFNPEKTVSLTFSTTGTYKYHNHLIPAQTATVIVQ